MAAKKPRKIFAFSSERLREIKQAALEDGALGKCSTFEALAAFIWRRAHAGSLPNKSSSDVLRLRFMVDTRNIVDPPLGENFCRNAAYGAISKLKLSELQDSSIVARIQEAKKRMTDEYVRSGWDVLELMNSGCVVSARLLDDDQCMADADAKGTGVGLRYWEARVEFPLDPRNSSIVFFPLCSDGILVSVSLDPVPLATFEKFIFGD